MNGPKKIKKEVYPFPSTPHITDRLISDVIGCTDSMVRKVLNGHLSGNSLLALKIMVAKRMLEKETKKAVVKVHAYLEKRELLRKTGGGKKNAD